MTLAAEPGPARGDDKPVDVSVAFVDASALVALADRDDASHDLAVSAYHELIAGGFQLFTTDVALAAAHELIALALGWGAARSWLALCSIHVVCVAVADVEAARATIEEGKTAHDAALADAIHLAVLDRLGVTEVFAVDRGFLAMLG